MSINAIQQGSRASAPCDPAPSIALCGFMACGKSTIGRALAARLGYAFADTDELLFKETGMTLQQMFAIGGESYFRDREHETILRAAQMARTVISTGGGVMTVERNARLLAEHTIVIHIHRSFEDCYACISARKNRPIAGRRSREELRAMYDARIAAYEKYAAYTLVNDGRPEETVDRAAAWIKDRLQAQR